MTRGVMSLAVCLTATLLLAAGCTPAAADNKPTVLDDGVPFVFVGNGQTQYFLTNLRSIQLEAAERGLSAPEVPPLTLSLTNVSTPASSLYPASTSPTMWASWEVEQPGPTNADYIVTSGVLRVSGEKLLGQYALYIAVDTRWTMGISLSIVFGIWQPVQLQPCPPLPQLSVVPKGALGMFSAALPTSRVNISSVAFNTYALQSSGPLSLFVSTSPNPTPINYQWGSNNGNLNILNTDPQWPANGQFYLAVGQSSSDALFVIQVTPDAYCHNNNEADAKRKPQLIALE